MKKFFIYSLFFLVIKTWGQHNKLVVKYDILYQTTKTLQRTGCLWADNEKAIFEVDILSALAKEEKNDKPEIKNTTLHVTKANITRNYYYLTFLKDNDFLFLDDLQKGKLVLISDKAGQKWKLTKETKQINNITCQKAICIFRGVEWEAWFAPSIPYPYGPWKLRGLPGLIIEAYDVNKIYNYSARSIEYTKALGLLDKDLEDLTTEKIYGKMTMKEFITQKDEALEAMLADMKRGGEVKVRNASQNGGKGRYGRELIYEWEEEPKK